MPLFLLWKGKEELAVWDDTTKVPQRISLSTYLLVIAMNASLTLQCDSLPVTGELALFQGLPRGFTQCRT